LFRWFKSSNQSTCPLCRNNFVYVWLCEVNRW
jgi:hypothetical protein